MTAAVAVKAIAMLKCVPSSSNSKTTMLPLWVVGYGGTASHCLGELSLETDSNL